MSNSCDPAVRSSPGSSVHRISQARILEWVIISFPKGSSLPRDWTCVSCIGMWIFTSHLGSRCIRYYTVIFFNACIKLCVSMGYLWSFPGSSVGKESAWMWEIWVRFQGWEDPLEEGMATHSSILAWRISMDRETWWATSMGSQRIGHDWASKHSTEDSAGKMQENEHCHSGEKSWMAKDKGFGRRILIKNQSMLSHVKFLST